MAFFIEKGDREGNRGYTPAVLEGEVSPDGLDLEIKAPEGFKWPSVSARQFHEVTDAAGPARYLEGPYTSVVEMK